MLAGRGYDTMRFGPLKPVGLVDPATGRMPHAVVQLRQDNAAKTLYNLVGFQTRLKFGEQKRVFSMIPGLERARFARYGVMHRNTYLNSPALLTSTYCSKSRPNLYFAGQLSGVEGYVESAASGLLCGIHAAQRFLGKKPEPFPPETAMGALAHYVATPGRRDFQPMNVNFGILAPLNLKASGRKDRNTKLAERALHIVDRLAKNL